VSFQQGDKGHQAHLCVPSTSLPGELGTLRRDTNSLSKSQLSFLPVAIYGLRPWVFHVKYRYGGGGRKYSALS